MGSSMESTRRAPAQSNFLDEAIRDTDALSRELASIQESGLAIEAQMEELGTTSQRVNQITDVLEAVAQQTRILAINAAVEAARSGTAGAAFAVVAKEVEDLARQSNNAAREVRGAIAGSSEAIDSVRQIAERLGSEVEKVAQRQKQIEQHLAQVQYHYVLREQADTVAQVKPQSFVFDPLTMSTGVATIDRQHRALFDGINKLDRACAEGQGKREIDAILDFLGKYVVEHFAHEEEEMDKHRCPVSAKNKQAHQALLTKYTEWKAEYDARGGSLQMVNELNTILKKWLVDHILGTDSCLKDCVKANRAGTRT